MLPLLVAAFAAEPDVLPASSFEIAFEGDASGEVKEALADLREGAFEAAAKRLEALVDAGGGIELRYLVAVAWYEAGQVRLAEQAVEDGLERQPRHPALLSLKGLVLADLGRGDEALRALDLASAVAAGDAELLARIGLNRAVVFLDRGEVAGAEAALAAALEQAERAQDADLVGRVAASRQALATLRGESGGPDAIAKVSEALAKGDLQTARAHVPADVPGDRRTQIRRSIALGVIARAEGKLDEAQRALETAVAKATEVGLLRERAIGTAQLGVLYVVADRAAAGRARLEEAVDLLSGTSLRVLELSTRVEAGRAAMRLGDAAGAKDHLAKARALAGPGDLSAQASLAELEGVVTQSPAALEKAMAAHEARGAWADVARVGCALVELSAGADEGVKQRALAAFERTGDALGPAHVGVAEGLGRAAKGDLDGAVEVFVAASKAAEAVGTPRGKQVAKIARENAARAVSDLTDSTAVLEQADRWDLEDLVARNVAFRRGREAYDAALADYNAGRYDQAYEGFAAAVRDLESIGETAYARVAQRGRAWSQFNAYTRASPETGFPVWQRLVEEGTLLQDAELRVRAMGAVALAAAELKRPEAVRSLTAAADQAEAMGLRPLAGQCRAALVEVVPGLDDKVAAARSAFELRDADTIGVYAIYSAAVAAYEADDHDRAIELATMILAVSGELEPGVRQVLEAARAAKSGG